MALPPAKPHGRFLAREAGELVGVSGTTIGQWARRGYIRPSQSAGDPHVYALEDVAEAAMVRALLAHGIARAQVRRVIAALAEDYGEWPLSDAVLAVTRDGGRPRVILQDEGGCFALSPRGWQRLAAPPPVEEVRLRLQRVRDPAAYGEDDGRERRRAR